MMTIRKCRSKNCAKTNEVKVDIYNIDTKRGLKYYEKWQCPDCGRKNNYLIKPPYNNNNNKKEILDNNTTLDLEIPVYKKRNKFIKQVQNILKKINKNKDDSYK